MEDLEIAIVMLGCVFNVVLILMCAISILLIYSLLMVSVEKKTFDTGVLRMVGVSKMDCILSITM
jgi:ABC-type lipoprotein release transport system permease subunit